VEALQSVTPDLSFEQALREIDPDGTVHDAASVLGRCFRLERDWSADEALEAIRLFCEIESMIRFSLWPGGNGAPHHFSKLLNTQKVKEVFSRCEILALLAISADPIGLNLRNVTVHGFSLDPSLSLPLLRQLWALLSSKLENPTPPDFHWDRELALFSFHQFRINLPPPLGLPGQFIFPLLDTKRRELLERAYELFDEGKFVDSLLLLFPVFEHSLRRAAVSTLDLPPQRLCASSEEHFLSILECLEVLPTSIQSALTDLLFAPDGPRIRDRIMHGNTREIPREFAECIFRLFEVCCTYFESEQCDVVWDLAFHPSRCLEYELGLVVNIRRMDFYKLYDSETCEKLIEVVTVTGQSVGTMFKDSLTTQLLAGSFQRFVCVCVLFMVGQKARASSVRNLLALAYAPSRLGKPVNDFERFRKTVAEKVTAIRGVLPFTDKKVACTYDTVLQFCADDSLLDSATTFLMSQIENADVS
jgi:hypothetical protein